VGGEWINLACGICLGDCACGATSEVLLPDPVVIDAVEVDGVELEEGVDWVLYDGQRLVRIGDRWPRCQDWEAVDGEGTWKVTARVGAAVPSLGRLAVGVLAHEFIKLCEDKPCNLPPQVTRVVRQGVTMEDMKVDENMLTGLWVPDRFILTYNPHLVVDRARAYSPDVPTLAVQGLDGLEGL
jgi:hypothetical protein